MIGVSAGRLRAYLRAGVLSPERGARGELRFSFQDLLLLRKAEGLVTHRIPPHRVRRALKRLRARLADDRPLTGVSLGTEGPEVIVHEGGARWQAESGQVLLAFDRAAPAPAGEEPPLSVLPTRRGGPAGRDVVPLTVDEIYELGCEVDETDAEHAEGCYRQVMSQVAAARRRPHQPRAGSCTSGRISRAPRTTTARRSPSGRTIPRRASTSGSPWRTGTARRGARSLSARDRRRRAQRRRALQRRPPLRSSRATTGRPCATSDLPRPRPPRSLAGTRALPRRSRGVSLTFSNRM